MLLPSQENVRGVLREKGFPIFKGPLNPTLFGLRAVPGKLDAFDDAVGVLYDDVHGEERMFIAPATLDPGKPSITNPKRPDGTAQIAEGHQRGIFTFGMHHPGTLDAYECLVPCKPVQVMRYKNAADFAAGRGTPSTSMTTQIHGASNVKVSTVVGPWSEGCGVTPTRQLLRDLLAVLHLGVPRWGRIFSFSLTTWPS